MTEFVPTSEQLPSGGQTGESTQDAAFEALRAEVFRKIGRNLMLFQQMEGMLKFLVANNGVAGYASEFEDIHAKRTEVIRKRTMGQLVGEFMETLLGEGPLGPAEPDELREVWVSYSFRIETDAARYEERKSALADVVADRNELIHHFLPRWNSNSVESTQDADRYLNCQRAKANVELEHLKSLVAAIHEGGRQFAQYFASAEMKSELKVALLRQSRLVILLGDIAQQIGRDDGCVLLNTAAQLLRQHAPEEFAAMPQRHGHQTLKSLILATELFDVVEEPSKKGGVRVLYRLKPEWTLQTGTEA